MIEGGKPEHFRNSGDQGSPETSRGHLAPRQLYKQASFKAVAYRHQASPSFKRSHRFNTMAGNKPEAMKGVTVQVSAETLEEALLVKVVEYLDDTVLFVVGKRNRHPKLQKRPDSRGRGMQQ